MATHTEHTAGGGHGRGGKNTYTHTHTRYLNKPTGDGSYTDCKEATVKQANTFFFLSVMQGTILKLISSDCQNVSHVQSLHHHAN